MSSHPVLATHALTIGYRTPRETTIIAHDLTLALQPGELVCLLGPNGAGKSTLLRTLTGLQPPLAGRVTLDQYDLHHLTPRERARQIGVVFTERIAAGLMTVYDLVALGRHPYTNWLGHLRPIDHAAIQQALIAVGADALTDRLVSQLSDGQRQKVLIARALAQDPALLVLDEPTAFLDLPHRVETLRLLRQLAYDQQRAVLLSIHDLDLALRHADRVWLMAADGQVVTGAPEDLVLNGALARAFAHHNLEFDPYSGAFQTLRPGTTLVAVEGQGLSATWTRRALERAGYTVAVNGQAARAAARISVSDGVNERRWQATVGTDTHSYATVHALIADLRPRLALPSWTPPPASPASARTGHDLARTEGNQAGYAERIV